MQIGLISLCFDLGGIVIQNLTFTPVEIKCIVLNKRNQIAVAQGLKILGIARLFDLFEQSAA